MYVIDDSDLGIAKRVRKEYVTLNIEKDIGELFKKIARENNITQTMLLEYLLKKASDKKGE
jgi:hypothetical protein